MLFRGREPPRRFPLPIINRIEILMIDSKQTESGRRNQRATELREEDEKQLRIYQKRCELLQDRTVSVTQRYQTGVYIVGRTGSGKTHTVLDALEKMEASYVVRNSHMTPMGLFEELANHPEHTIVLDDIPNLFGKPQALQILMAALGGEPGQPRLVTYSAKSTAEGCKSFHFVGGIIAISNLPMRRDPLSDALGSRLVLLQHEPSDEELAAVMRDAACKGFENLTADECREVVEFVIAECRTNEFRLNLRFMRKGLEDFRQHKDGFARRPWQELSRSNMQQLLHTGSEAAVTKQEQIKQEVELVRTLEQKFPGETKRQMAESGLRKTVFYERRRQARRPK
jgi:hypothetical protein